MDITDGRCMLRAVKYSCVVVSSNRRVLTAPRCGWPSRYLCCWLDDLHANAQAGFVNRQDSVVHAVAYLQFSAKTDVKTSSNASTQYPK